MTTTTNDRQEITPRIVLVGTQLADNLGAVCRTMRAFGLPQLALVSPECAPDEQGCIALAAGAHDLATAAPRFANLTDALQDTPTVVGLTRRSGRGRRLDGTIAEVFALLEQVEGLCFSNVAFVFGPEASGLSAAHIERCDLLADIPTGTGTQGSLNLAHAVTCVCYEFSRVPTLPALTITPPKRTTTTPLSQARDTVREALLRYLECVDFYTSEPPHIVDQRISHILRRSLLTSHDLVFLTKMVQKLTHRKGPHS